MSKYGMAKDTMTMQQRKDHMAMGKNDRMKNDDAMMKKDATCADMVKTEGIMKDRAAIPSDGTASGATKRVARHGMAMTVVRRGQAPPAH